MKILHGPAGKNEKEAAKSAPGKAPGKPSVPARPAPALGNPESLRAMLDCIRQFRAGSLKLGSLVSELEYHLQALIMDDHHWQSAFFERWRELDRHQSLQLTRGQASADDEAIKRIDAAIEELRQLITSVVSGLETR